MIAQVFLIDGNVMNRHFYSFINIFKIAETGCSMIVNQDRVPAYKSMFSFQTTTPLKPGIHLLLFGNESTTGRLINFKIDG
jgi:hypothetical protein